MKLTICGSLDFTYEMDEIRKKLENFGFEVNIPPTAQRILNEEFTLDEIKLKKENGSFSQLAIENDAIKRYFNIIKDCDCVLVANYDKKLIKNYIGGAVFLEIGFAHILNKKIYLLNDIPEMIYTDEIKAMQPIILNGDLSKIN
ncbi:MAG: hypothetical protein PHH83_01060 [Patescibacteria group bacterium]|nr:hypothetical protein [Patescibacteria group bacterium]